MTTLTLLPEIFAPAAREIARHGGITVTAFRYPSGVAALRVTTAVGEAVLLPFQGQQIWDAAFHGRRLTMRTVFDQPIPTRDYLRTYGAFFLHCGGTSMGNPGPEDNHPLHGELPNLPYDRATLTFGTDESGPWVELSGEATDRVAFDHVFAARPRLRMREDAATFEAAVAVQNLGGSPMPFFYLGHVNFHPVSGARIVDSLPDAAPVVLREILQHPGASQAAHDWQAGVQADPAHHRQVPLDDSFPRELVATLQPGADADGWAHALQLHPDGSADFVSHRPAELPRLVRWMTRGPDMQALGFALPATAWPDGRAAAYRNGEVTLLAPGQTFTASFRFGAALPDAARRLGEAAARAARG